jgi:(p)ppGpp synthase/HD superfamily hydrolase
VIGFLTSGEGIKIHRTSCNNIKNIIERSEYDTELKNKLISITWPNNTIADYLVGITLEGDDKNNLLAEIARSISSFNNTTIKSVNFDSKDNKFYGTVTLFVKNIDYLKNIMERLKKIPGIIKVTRIE